MLLEEHIGFFLLFLQSFDAMIKLLELCDCVALFEDELSN